LMGQGTSEEERIGVADVDPVRHLGAILLRGVHRPPIRDRGTAPSTLERKNAQAHQRNETK